MAVTNPRNHLVSFRLTAQEHARLQDLTNEHGARSLADFVRSIVCRLMEQAMPGPSAAGVAARVAGPRPLSMGAEREAAATATENLVALLFYLRRDMEWLDQELRALAAELRGLNATNAGKLLEFQGPGSRAATRPLAGC